MAIFATAISYRAAKWWALLATLILIALVEAILHYRGTRQQDGKIERRPWFSFLLGADGRLSTSKTVAAAWTAVVVYILLALLFAWPSDWDAALKNLSPTYLLLLGGPYASLVLSKGIVNGKLSSGTLQKTSGDGVPRISDLVADDAGQPDLFDGQYVLFNLIAMAYVIDAFVRSSLGSGFPPIPTGLILLTGGPAAIYVVNKAASSNNAVMTGVVPASVRPLQPIQIVGQNLVPDVIPGILGAPPPDQPGPTLPTVLIGGAKADVLKDGVMANQITAAVPVPATAPTGPLDVAVITTAGQRVALAAALTVLPPTITALDKSTAQAGDDVAVSGAWTSTDDVKPTVIVNGVTVDIKAEPKAGASLTFAVPQLPGPFPIDAKVWLAVGPQTSEQLALTVTA